MNQPSNIPVTISIQGNGDPLTVTGFRLEHELGKPFFATLSVSSTNTSIAPLSTIGQQATVTIMLQSNQPRYLCGYVSHFSWLGADSLGNALYSLVVVPGIWMLSRSSASQIFLGQTYSAIVQSILGEKPWSTYVPAVSARFSEAYDSRPMTVQYNETYLNFINRIMEQEGIWYYFDQEDTKGTTYLCDSASDYQSFSPCSTLLYNPQKDYLHGKEHIYFLAVDGQVVPQSATAQDYDYLQASSFPLSINETNNAQPSGFSITAYPGYYNAYEAAATDTQSTGGTLIATVLAQEQGEKNLRLRGKSNSLSLAVGYTMGVTGYTFPEGMNSTLLITGQTLIVTPGSADSALGYYCECEFTAIPTQVNSATTGNLVDNEFRPPQVTPKPRISGCQSARAWAPSSDGNYTTPNMPYCNSTNETGQLTSPACNTLGCVHLSFPWDPNWNNATTAPTPPIRVSQFSAGGSSLASQGHTGALFLPLPGSEVLVAFEEGDPDRPVVVGSVYNSSQLPPTALPVNNGQSIIQDQWGNSITFTPKVTEEDHGSQKTTEPTIVIQPGDNQSSSIQIGGPEGIIMTTKGNHQAFVNGSSEEWWQGTKNVGYYEVTNTYFGLYDANIVGDKSQVCLGAETKLNAGYKMETYFGLKACYIFGPKIDWEYTRTWNMCTGERWQQALAYTFFPLYATYKGLEAGYTWATTRWAAAQEQRRIANLQRQIVQQDEQIANRLATIEEEDEDVLSRTHSFAEESISGGSSVRNVGNGVESGEREFEP